MWVTQICVKLLSIYFTKTHPFSRDDSLTSKEMAMRTEQLSEGGLISFLDSLLVLVSVSVLYWCQFLYCFHLLCVKMIVS